MLERASMPEPSPRPAPAPEGLPARHAKPLLALVILAAASLYLVGNGSVSLWDRDEPRYAQCSRQMLYGFPGGAGPDWVVPRFLDGLRTEKPPFVYWCQAASMKLFGDTAFAARFPSAVAMTLVLLLLSLVLYRVIGPARTVWSVFVFAASGLTIMSAKMCLTDATLLLWIVTAQACLFAVYRGNRSWGVTLTLWLAIGMGGLTKGPIVLAVLFATMAALAALDFFLKDPSDPDVPRTPSQPRPEGPGFDPSQARSKKQSLLGVIRWWAGLRPWVGLPVAAAIVAAWMIAVHQREPDFLGLLFKAAERHLKTGEKHNGPPGFYLALVWGLWFPWSLLLPTTLVFAWRNRREPILRYCLAVVLGIWVFQEVMTTKLPFYLLPTFPALAVLTADTISRCLRREADDLTRPAFAWAAGIWAVAVLAMGAAPWILALPRFNLSTLLPRTGMPLLSAAAVVYASVVPILFATRRTRAALVSLGVGALSIFALLFTAYLPQARFLQISQRAAEVLRAERVAPGDAVMMIQYKEPSLAFYHGGRTIEQPMDHYLDHAPLSAWPRWVVMPRDLYEKETSTASKANLEEVGPPIRGIDYAGKVGGSQFVEVVVLRKKDARVAPMNPDAQGAADQKRLATVPRPKAQPVIGE